MKTMARIIIKPGMTFNKLTVIEISEVKRTASGSKTNWLLQCECGGTTITQAGNLSNNHTTSCGCVTKSIGETNVEKILTDNNVSFKSQYKFSDCRDKRELPFDTAVLNKDTKQVEYIIEFDGTQHKKPSRKFGMESFLKTQQHDKIKNDYCKENNIPLIRIPYEKRDKMTIEMLTPITSPYLV